MATVKKVKSSLSEKESGKLNELFVDGLKDIYWAENHLTQGLTKMAEASTSNDLRAAFESHLTETQGHIKRLEQVFDIIGQKVAAKKCEAMAGLLKEGDEITESTEKGTIVRDCGLIMAAQKVEHYEMATYGTLRNIAQILGHNDAADLLQATLNEEGIADKKLTELAETHINQEAEQE